MIVDNTVSQLSSSDESDYFTENEEVEDGRRDLLSVTDFACEEQTRKFISAMYDIYCESLHYGVDVPEYFNFHSYRFFEYFTTALTYGDILRTYFKTETEQELCFEMFREFIKIDCIE